VDTLVTYGRVSDKGKQGDNFSIPTQLKMMRAWAESQHYEVTELHEEDSAYIEGLSRSKLQQALELARAGKINVLMFFSPDRFTRDMADGVILRRELRRCGVKLMCYYPTPREITSDMEILHILTDWQSQQYIERMREASMRGVKGKADMGLFTQGNPPYGYRLEGRKQETRLVIFEEEAYYVRLTFDWYYYQNTSARDIAQRLNEMVAPLPKSSLGGREWTSRLVRHILRNETYAGVWYAYKWKKTGKRKFEMRPKEERQPIPVPQIIPRVVWEATQRKLDSRHVGRDTLSQYLMSSRIDCVCGVAVGGHRSSNGYTPQGAGPDFKPKTYYWYRCGSRETLKGSCGLRQYNARAVDDLVWKFAYELIQEPEKLLEAYREVQEEDAEKYDFLKAQIEALDEQIAQGEKELAEIVGKNLKTESPTLKSLYNQREEEYGAAIDKLKTRREVLRAEYEGTPFTDEHIAFLVAEVEELRKMYEALYTIDEEADFDAKRALIDILNIRATLRVDSEGTRWVDIHWLTKTYPKIVAPKVNDATRQSQASNAVAVSGAGG